MLSSTILRRRASGLVSVLHGRVSREHRGRQGMICPWFRLKLVLTSYWQWSDNRWRQQCGRCWGNYGWRSDAAAENEIEAPHYDCCRYVIFPVCVTWFRHPPHRWFNWYWLVCRLRISPGRWWSRWDPHRMVFDWSYVDQCHSGVSYSKFFKRVLPNES